MTKQKKFWLTMALSFLPLSAAFAGPVPPKTVVGQFGFDWLKPKTAKCVEITADAAAKFKACVYQSPGETGSFTGNADFYECEAGAKSQYMIYKTKARCAEELETMQANGD